MPFWRQILQLWCEENFGIKIIYTRTALYSNNAFGTTVIYKLIMNLTLEKIHVKRHYVYKRCHKPILKMETCIEINGEYGTNWNFLSLLQIKESIPSTCKKIIQDDTDTLNCPLHVFDLLLLQNQFLINIIQCDR